MKTRSEPDRRATDAVAISERARQQIGSQASQSKARLKGPAFFEFPEGFSDGPAIHPNGINIATVRWRGIE
jgi:hypothetical protein